MLETLIEKEKANEELDEEWVELILEALNYDIPLKEIRNFLNENNRPE